MLLLYVCPCTRSSVSMQNSFAHMNEQNAQHSTPDISQHIYSLKDPGTLLLSEGAKSDLTRIQWQIKPPVLRVHSQLGSWVTTPLACSSRHLRKGIPGISTPSRSTHSSALALQLPQCRHRGAALSAVSLLSPTAPPAPPALLSLLHAWLWSPHTNTDKLSPAPPCTQGWATPLKPHPEPSHLCTLNLQDFQTTPT